MNPLARTKCAGGLLMALAAVSSILLMAACGSSNNSPAPNQVGFGLGTLNSTYVFSSQGSDAAHGAPLALAGAFTADGNGGIKGGGTIDIIDPAGTEGTPIAQPITAGSYTLGTDGRGQVTLKSFYGTFVLDFVLTSSSHGLVSEFDKNGTGSGTLDLQTAVASLPASYAFSLAGLDSLGNTLALAGAFTLNSSNMIASGAGTEDFNDAGIFGNSSLTGSASLGSGTAPGAITLTTSTFPLTFDFYPINSSHWKIIETDTTGNALAGDVFTQTSTAIPTGPMAFTMGGGVTAPIADGGFMTISGTSFSGTEDVNNNGTLVQSLAITGTAGTAGSTGGRVVVSNIANSPTTQLVVYPSSGGLLLLENDSSNVTIGAAYPQSATTIGTSQAYGLNLSAIDLNSGAGDFEEDDIAQFTTSSSGFTGIVDINDQGTLTASQSFAGSYPIPVDSTGRGGATATANGANFVSFLFYVVNSSTVLILEADTFQIGVGTFEAQSSGAAGAAQSHSSLVRPAARLHGAAVHRR